MTTHVERRSRTGRPLRRLRRWARYTANGEIALTLVCLGSVLVAVALVLAITT